MDRENGQRVHRQKGLEKQQKQGIPLKLVCMVVEAADADPFGYNPIFAGEERIGMTSSGGYGHRVGKSIAMGYVKPAFAKEGTTLEVEILGRKRSASVVAMPLYDPKNEKMKS
jgi:dimethylglycine dehydrogenase